MSPTTEAVLHTRIKPSGNMWSKIKFHMVTNVAIQVALPQLCTKNLPEKQVQAKSDLSKQIAETAKKCLRINIKGKDYYR